MIDVSKKIIETKMASIFWEDEKNGILFAASKPVDLINIEDAIATINVYKDSFHHPNKKLIVDISEQRSLNKEVRDYMSGPEGVYNYFNAIAVLTDSKYSPTSMIVSTLLKIIKTQKPTSMFSDKRAAVDWLMSIY